MLVRLKADDGFVYVNPDQVFVVGKRNDGSTAIWASANKDDYIIVDEPLDRVAMRLNDALRR